MKAIILAGGQGTRLYPVTLETPKPLLTVRKKPIINYLIEHLLEEGVTDIGVTIRADHRDDFMWWYKRWWEGRKSLQFFEEHKPLGTFGALFSAREWVGNEPFLVTNGDELKRPPFGEFMRLHESESPIAVVGLVRTADPRLYGVALMDGNKITAFVEKPENPPSNFISSGSYLFTPEIFAHGTENEFLMLERDLFPKLAEAGALHGIPYEGPHFDCGTLERWEKAIKEWPE